MLKWLEWLPDSNHLSKTVWAPPSETSVAKLSGTIRGGTLGFSARGA